MKIACIVGARPQFIKLALLAEELRKNNEVIVIHTDQHYDYLMSKSFFDQLGIRDPEYHLGVGSGSHGAQTGDMLKSIEKVLLEEKPQLVVVFGDTNSTLAGALAAVKLHIKLAHVEAGLRNFDKKKPEEINRLITDRVADFFFAPSANARENLNKEGIFEHIYIVGDISNDVLLTSASKAESISTFLQDHALSGKSYYLLTIHKSKNTDSERNLRAIITTIAKLEDRVLFPVHPRTRQKLTEYGLMDTVQHSAIELIDPLTYFDMIVALKHAKKVVTDSGGVQKEAYALQVPCITLRKTEWVETVEDGWNVEVDIHHPESFLETVKTFAPTTMQSNFLGTGDTYKKIARILCEEMS